MSDEDLAWSLRTFKMLRTESRMTSRLDPTLLGRLHRHFTNGPLENFGDIIAERISTPMPEPVRALLKEQQNSVHARIPERVSRPLWERISKRVVVGLIYNNVERSVWEFLVTADYDLESLLDRDV